MWSLYPKVLVGRKPVLLRAGSTVPLIEAQIDNVCPDAAHLRAYRVICGAAQDNWLPIAYPHVLASGLHLAVLSHETFPVKLLGLVHVRNRIRQYRGLPADQPGKLSVAIEGHEDTDRGQEFTLRTQWHDPDGELLWEEECVFLSRRKRSGASSEVGGREKALADAASRPAGLRTTSFRAPAGLGRSYGLLGGDLNPIHLADLSAKMFGFKSAIAHGMWSLARTASDLDSELLQIRCELNVAFKLPVFLPSWLVLEQWGQNDGIDFTLRDGQGQRPHLSGSLRPLQ